MVYIRPSLEYIPEELRDYPVYQTATELIDGVRRKPDLQIALALDNTVDRLLSGYTDYRAVQAYYNMFVRPSLGTKSALLFALRILNIDARLFEWFEADFNLNAYKFGLDFDDYPATLDLDRLIDLVNFLKNERSRLAVIRQPDEFQDMGVTDESYMDDALWEDVSGTTYRGVNVFLVKRFNSFYAYPGVAAGSSQQTLAPRGYELEYRDQLDSWTMDTQVNEMGAGSYITTGFSSYVNLASGYTFFLTQYDTGADFAHMDESFMDSDQFYAAQVSDEDSNYVRNERRISDGVAGRTVSVAGGFLYETRSSYADASTISAGSGALLETRMTSITIPRQGYGPARGGIDRYQVSAASTMRNL